MCIGTCRKCKGDIHAGDEITTFFDGDKLFHDECCPVESEFIEDFGGVKMIAEESMHPFYREN